MHGERPGRQSRDASLCCAGDPGTLNWGCITALSCIRQLRDDASCVVMHSRRGETVNRCITMYAQGEGMVNGCIMSQVMHCRVGSGAEGLQKIMHDSQVRAITDANALATNGNYHSVMHTCHHLWWQAR
jgi:hypothetical protein